METNQKFETKIYKNKKEFDERESLYLNGIDAEFAKKNPNWKEMNFTNYNCWNCLNCEKCYTCLNCEDCKNSKHLKNRKNWINKDRNE